MKIKSFKPKMLIALALLLLPTLAAAQDGDLNGANTAWIMTSTALVLFMTLPGLSLFYAGLVRTKNALSVLMQCFAIAVVVSLLWLVPPSRPTGAGSARCSSTVSWWIP